MTKAKRKLYRIKELRREGFNYEERGKKIGEYKKVGTFKGKKEVKGGEGKLISRQVFENPIHKKWSWWKRLAVYFKSLFYGKENI